MKIRKEVFKYLQTEFLQQEGRDNENFHYTLMEGYVCVQVDDETMDEIRDWASERQQRVGFDKNYDLTPEGKLLEQIIDMFYQ